LIPVLQECLQVAEKNVTRAAYIGASNGDAPEFFELFCAALDAINLHEARMIRAGFGSDDRAFLESADLVLLAGGDVEAGWDIITGTGMDAIITKKYYDGAVVAGVSAGAVHLGMGWYTSDHRRFSPGLKLFPYYAGVHGERADWLELRRLVETGEEPAPGRTCRGYGIPSGGALIYHADRSLEAVRYPVTEFSRSVNGNGEVQSGLLVPVIAPALQTKMH